MLESCYEYMHNTLHNLIIIILHYFVVAMLICAMIQMKKTTKADASKQALFKVGKGPAICYSAAYTIVTSS